MASKFNENGVITGIADCFCLSCQEYLKLKDVAEHISASNHWETFQSTNYVEKYKEDRIRMVKLGYYCEICNIMIQTLAKTGIHVNEVTHVNNKNGQQLKVSEAGVVAFDDILIENNAWHGLADGSCLICSVDYSDEDDHKNEPTHILKLIQSKFELEKNKYVYRKIDGDSINCLICNTIIMNASKEAHTNESEHKNNYIKCQEDKISKIEATNNNASPENDMDIKNISNKVFTKLVESKKDIRSEIKTVNDCIKTEKYLEKNSSTEDDISDLPLDKSRKDLLKIEAKNDVESETDIVVCNTEGVEQVGKKDDSDKVTPEVALQKLKEFAKQNNLKYKRNGTYCEVCDVKMSSTLKMMKEHVAESSHKEKAANKTTRKLNKVAMKAFVTTYTSAKGLLCHDIIINEKICINVLSFYMLSLNPGHLWCQACEVRIGLNEADEHKVTLRHDFAMEFLPVITDFETEFVRELRSEVYHCGYCNIIETSLKSLQSHLKSSNHREKKSLAQQRLAIHLPNIAASREEEQKRHLMRMIFS